MLAGIDWSGKMVEFCHKALASLGHEVKIFYFNKDSLLPETFLRETVLTHIASQKIVGMWRSAMNRRFLKDVLSFQPSLIIIFKGDNLYPETIMAIKERLGIPVFNWCGDDPFRYPLLIKSAPHYDRIFLTDAIHIQQLSFLTKKPVLHLLNAADPDTYRPVELSGTQRKDYGCDICIVASSDNLGIGGTFRVHMLKALGTGFDLRIYGDNGWKIITENNIFLTRIFMKKALTSEETNIAYNAAKIVLNINHPQNNKWGVGQRTFEIPCAGGFQLMDKRGGVEEFFKMGEEIVCYDTMTELKDMVVHYLADPVRRAEISRQARKRVLDSHTYHHRMQILLGYF